MGRKKNTCLLRINIQENVFTAKAMNSNYCRLSHGERVPAGRPTHPGTVKEPRRPVGWSRAEMGSSKEYVTELASAAHQLLARVFCSHAGPSLLLPTEPSVAERRVKRPEGTLLSALRSGHEPLGAEGREGWLLCRWHVSRHRQIPDLPAAGGFWELLGPPGNRPSSRPSAPYSNQP